MKKMMIISALCVVSGSLVAADTKTDKDEKVIGTVLVEDGQKMPIRVAFVHKATDEKRTNPISVLVKDGKIEIPTNLQRLPAGYILTTFPCVKLKAVMVAGVDIRSPQSDVSLRVGAGDLARAFGVGGGLASIASSLLGGVQFDDCGGAKK